MTNAHTMRSIGPALKSMRTKAGLSLQQLGDGLGVTRQTASAREHEDANPAWGSILDTLQQLDATPLDLVRELYALQGLDLLRELAKQEPALRKLLDRLAEQG